LGRIYEDTGQGNIVIRTYDGNNFHYATFNNDGGLAVSGKVTAADATSPGNLVTLNQLTSFGTVGSFLYNQANVKNGFPEYTFNDTLNGSVIGQAGTWRCLGHIVLNGSGDWAFLFVRIN
jgi:hypothetical protein